MKNVKTNGEERENNIATGRKNYRKSRINLTSPANGIVSKGGRGYAVKEIALSIYEEDDLEYPFPDHFH